MIFPDFLSMATIDGSSTTILSLHIITVLAVPKSIATSLVKNENKPIYFVFLSFLFYKLLQIEAAKLYNFFDISV
jgi:uncharacterized membrane protein